MSINTLCCKANRLLLNLLNNTDGLSTFMRECEIRKNTIDYDIQRFTKKILQKYDCFTLLKTINIFYLNLCIKLCYLFSNAKNSKLESNRFKILKNRCYGSNKYNYKRKYYGKSLSKSDIKNKNKFKILKYRHYHNSNKNPIVRKYNKNNVNLSFCNKNNNLVNNYKNKEYYGPNKLALERKYNSIKLKIEDGLEYNI